MNHKLDDSANRQNNVESNAENTGSVGDMFDHLIKRQSSIDDKTEPSQPELYAQETEAISTEQHQHDTSLDRPETAAMPGQARRALVSLLRFGVILANQKSKLFESVCRYQPAIRRHLADVYLSLVLDEKADVAFVAAQHEEDDAEARENEEPLSLISRRTLSLYDTLLLLVLRKHYQKRETSGEQLIMVDVERIESYLTPFLPLTNSATADRKKLNAALQKMVSRRILRVLRGNDDRFEITPIIRYVVNAAFLESMLGEYLQLARENSVSLSDDSTAVASANSDTMKLAGQDNE